MPPILFAPQRRLPLFLALALAAVWQAVSVWHIAHGAPVYVFVLSWAVAAPLALALIALAFLPQAGRGIDLEEVDERVEQVRGRVEQMAAQAEAVAASLGEFTQRVRTIAETAERHGEQLARAARAIATASADAQRGASGATTAAEALVATLPRVAEQTREIDATLRRTNADAEQQLRALDTLLGAVRLQNSESVAAAD